MPWEWIAAGVVLLVVIVFCVRLMKSGLTTLEDERARCDERIRTMEEQVRQDQKNMPSSEHLHIALAGLRDMLRLADYPSGFWLEVAKDSNGAASEKNPGAAHARRRLAYKPEHAGASVACRAQGGPRPGTLAFVRI